MSVLENNSVTVYCSDEAIVEVATPDYLECLGIEDYLKRCKELGIKFNQSNRDCIQRMKQLKDEGHGSDVLPIYGVIMADCMAKTFNLRFTDIGHHSLSVRNAVAIYPGLLDFQEIRREFERITGKSVKAFESHLNCVLKEYAKNQICKEYYACTSSFCMESLEILREDGGKGNNARVTAARIMIFACAQSDKTWWDVIFKIAGESEESGIARPHPTVLVHGSPFEENCADVYCEEIQIVGGVNFYEAILTSYYLYYVFNLSFPPLDLEIYQHFEKLINLMAPIEEKAYVSVEKE